MLQRTRFVLGRSLSLSYCFVWSHPPMATWWKIAKNELFEAIEKRSAIYEWSKFDCWSKFWKFAGKQTYLLKGLIENVLRPNVYHFSAKIGLDWIRFELGFSMLNENWQLNFECRLIWSKISDEQRKKSRFMHFNI